MDASDFLFPRDLKVTDVPPKNVLLLGSCLSEAYKIYFSKCAPETQFDHILYNNFSDLPDSLPRDILSYDLVYLQIPLRSVLSDAVIRIGNIFLPEMYGEIIGRAKYTIEAMLEEGLKFNRSHGVTTVVSNFILPQSSAAPSFQDFGTPRDLRAVINELNSYIVQCVGQRDNVFIADVDAVASSIGKMHVLDDLIYFYSHGSIVNPIWTHEENYPHWTSPEPGRIEAVPDFNEFYPSKHDLFFKAMYAQLVHIYRVAKQVDQVKVVIFDLDNTLWRGQIGDHYASGSVPPHSDGWPLGIWEAIHHLKARGILVSICSKNDARFVEENWGKAINLPFISLSDFVAPQINYSSKAQNIDIILKSLSLTAKSAVFVDDNPVERSAVISAHPGIRTIGSNPFLTRRILLWSAETQVPRLTSESIRRDDMIRKQISRENERSGLTREEFLKSLDTRVSLIHLRTTEAPSFSRVYELLNKTNQFNTTGKRWEHKQLHQLFADGGEIYAFSVGDRFSEYGLVGIIIIKDKRILQYVMSCRVLGMDVELAALSWVVRQLFALGMDEIRADLVVTEANMPCRDVFTRGGFSVDEEHPGTFFIDRSVDIITPQFVQVVEPDM